MHCYGLATTTAAILRVGATSGASCAARRAASASGSSAEERLPTTRMVVLFLKMLRSDGVLALALRRATPSAIFAAISHRFLLCDALSFDFASFFVEPIAANRRAYSKWCNEYAVRSTRVLADPGPCNATRPFDGCHGAVAKHRAT